MSRVSDAAERVEAFLRRHNERTAEHESVSVEANGETLTLQLDDLSLLVECAQWLLMASVGDVHREYATTTESQGLVGTHLHPADLPAAQGNVDRWNRMKRDDVGFVAQRLVTDWERRA